jgi:hypothetical protein
MVIRERPALRPVAMRIPHKLKEFAMFERAAKRYIADGIDQGRSPRRI